MIRNKYLYWISTISLFSMLILTGVFYMVFYDKLVGYFDGYGYPKYLILPLAVAKIGGSLVVLFYNKSLLRELAYAGFFFNFVLAFFAHLMIGEFDPFPTIFMALLVISYVTGKKIGR